jgi:methionyl-tRNA formyltransferase
MPSLRILFMGTPDFAVPSLEALISTEHAVIGVVTGPDKPRGRGQAVIPTPVKVVAGQCGIPVLQPEDLADARFEESVRSMRPDLVVVVAFRILPPSIFSIPRLGSFNLHASLLPRYRGAAPINWAIINGDEETGVTTFFLEKHVDTGSMILQERMPILPEDDAGSLHDSLAKLGAGAVVETVRRIAVGNVATEQQDPSQVSKAPKIFKDDCRIPWNRPAREVRDFIRGMSPSPGAWTMDGERLLKFFKTAVVRSALRQPGFVEVSDNQMLVHCADSACAILELQQEGRKRMGIQEFLRGSSIQRGTILR